MEGQRVMHIVFKDKHGDIKWDNKIEVESLEEFVKDRNQRARNNTGVQRDICFVSSKSTVTEYSQIDWAIAGKYYVCDPKVARLL
jgi:hypothetical protein